MLTSKPNLGKNQNMLQSMHPNKKCSLNLGSNVNLVNNEGSVAICIRLKVTEERIATKAYSFQLCFRAA